MQVNLVSFQKKKSITSISLYYSLLSPCWRGFLRVLQIPPTVLKHALLIGASKLAP